MQTEGCRLRRVPQCVSSTGSPVLGRVPFKMYVYGIMYVWVLLTCLCG